MSAEDDEIQALSEAFARGEIDVEEFEELTKLALSRPKPRWHWVPPKQRPPRDWSVGGYFARQWRERGILALVAILVDGWLLYCLVVGLPWALYWGVRFMLAASGQ